MHTGAVELSDNDPKRALRPYDFWEYAETCFSTNADGIALGSDIGRLWNAVDCRVKHFAEIYRLKTIKTIVRAPSKDSDYLSTLGDIGVIRPRLAKDLKVLRNKIEHQYSDPSGYEQCMDFLDIVWYFLKATDVYVLTRMISLEIETESNSSNMTLVFDYPDWRFGVWGTIPAPNILKCPSSKALRVDATDIQRIGDDYIRYRGFIASSADDKRELVTEYFRSMNGYRPFRPILSQADPASWTISGDAQV